jgi:hypothetical protein
MLASLRRILALIRKELLAVLKDPRTRNMLLLQPALQMLLFGYAATLDLSNVPYAAFDRDRSAASSALLAKLDGSGVFHRVANLTDAADMRRLVDSQRVLMVVQIGPDFERRLSRGADADVQVIADGRNSSTAGAALGYVGAAVQSFNADWRAAHGLAPPPVRVSTRAWYNPNLETRWNLVPALVGTLTFMSTMMVAAISVAREREEGTFDQILVTPFHPVEIMAGKALPAMLIGLVEDRGEHAAGDALRLRPDNSVRPAVGPSHANQQHATDHPRIHRDQPVALRHRHRPSRLPGRGRPGSAAARPLANGDHSGGDAGRRSVAVPQSARISKPCDDLRAIPTS